MATRPASLLAAVAFLCATGFVLAEEAGESILPMGPPDPSTWPDAVLNPEDAEARQTLDRLRADMQALRELSRETATDERPPFGPHSRFRITPGPSDWLASAAFDPLAREFMVAWDDQSQSVRAQRLAASGEVVGPPIPVSFTQSYPLSIAFSPTSRRYAVVSNYGSEALIRFLAEDGTPVGEPETLDQRVPEAGQYINEFGGVDVVWQSSSNRFLVLWMSNETRPGASVFRLMAELRNASDGAVVEGRNDVVLRELPPDVPLNSPKAACNEVDDEFWVLYEASGVFGFGIDGDVTSMTTPVVDFGGFGHPSVEWSPLRNEYLVAMSTIQYATGGFPYWYVSTVRRVGTDGSFLGPSVTVGRTGLLEYAQTLSYNPASGGYLLAWTTTPLPSGQFTYDVNARELDSLGEPAGQVIELSGPADTETTDLVPTISCDTVSGRWLVAWSRLEVEYPYNTQIWGEFVTPTVTPPDLRAPTISVSSPAQDEAFVNVSSITPVFSAEDEQGGSGLESVSGLLDSTIQVRSGEPLDVTALASGRHTLAVVARDRAGNESRAEVSFILERVDARYGPADTTIGRVPPNSAGVTMLQFRVARGGNPAPLALTSVTLAASGSGDDSLLAAVRLVRDLYSDGEAGAGDPVLAAGTFSTDDGQIAFLGLSSDLPPDGVADYLVVIDFGGGERFGKSFSMALIGAVTERPPGSYDVSGLPLRGGDVLVDDVKAPVVDILVPSDGSSLPDNGQVTIDITAQDEPLGSGVASLQATLDGNPVANDATLELSTLPVGDHTLVAVATDVAGNQTTATSTFRTVAPQQALQDVANSVQGLIGNTPPGPARDNIEDALDLLVGNNGGRSGNGAITLMTNGDVVGAMVKIQQAVRKLRQAQQGGADTTELQMSLAGFLGQTMAARVTHLEDLLGADDPRLAQIQAFMSQGDTAFAGGDYLAAVTNYKQAQQRVIEMDRDVVLEPAVVTILDPAGEFVTTRTPRIRVQYVDLLCLIRTSEVTISVDGEPRRDFASVGPYELILDIPGSVALSDGPHTVRIVVPDSAGNLAVVQWTIFVDLLPPVITAVTPADEALVADSTTDIAVSYADAGSGIDLSSVKLTFDSLDITSIATVGAAGVSYSFASAIPEGTHSLRIEVVDRAGLLASRETTFRIDTRPPRISLLPYDGAILTTDHPGLAALYEDDVSGVALSSVAIQLDGVVRTAEFAPTERGARLQIGVASPLAQGSHTLSVAATDAAGNASNATSAFVVDSISPVARVVSPDNGSAAGATPSIEVEFTDIGTGVDPTSLSILVDLEDRTGRFTVTGGGATWQLEPADALVPGAHSVSVEVRDLAGNAGRAVALFEADTTPQGVAEPVVGIVHPDWFAFKAAGTRLLVDVEAVDRDGIDHVELLVDGVEVQQLSVAPYVFELTLPLEETTLVLTAIAEDTLGNRRESFGVTVVVVAAPESGVVELDVLAEPPTIAAGETALVTIRALDANGDLVPDFEGTVSLYEVRGSWFQAVEFLPEDGGVRVVETPALTRSGENVLVAEAMWPYPQGVGGADRVRVLPGPVGTIEVFPLSGPGMVGGEAIAGFGVIVLDIFGNPIPGEVVEIRIEEDRSGQVSEMTLTTGPDGTAQTSPMFVQEGTRGLTVGARLQQSPEVRDDAQYQVAAPRMVELIAAFRVVQAGQAVGYSIRVLKYDGSVDQDFEGVVYVAASGGQIVPVPFTRSDQGVRFVPDMLWFQVMGRRQVWASTALIPDFQGDPTLGPVSGVSEGITVLAGEPDRVVNLDVGTLDPVTQLPARRAYAQADVLDKFGNLVFDEGVEFCFAFEAEVEVDAVIEVRTLAESSVTTSTDLFGRARAYSFTIGSELAQQLVGLTVLNSWVRATAKVPSMADKVKRALEKVAEEIQVTHDSLEETSAARAPLQEAKAALLGPGEQVGAVELLTCEGFNEAIAKIQTAIDRLASAESAGAPTLSLRLALEALVEAIQRAFRELAVPWGLQAPSEIALGQEAAGTVVPGQMDQPVSTVLSASMAQVTPSLNGARKLVVLVQLTLAEPDPRIEPGSDPPEYLPQPWRFTSAPTASLSSDPPFTWELPQVAPPPEANPSLGILSDTLVFTFVSVESINPATAPPRLDVSLGIQGFHLDVEDDDRVNMLPAGEIRCLVDIQSAATRAERVLAAVEAVDIVTLRTEQGRFVFLQDPDEYLTAETARLVFDEGIAGGPNGVFQVRLRTPQPRGVLAAGISSVDELGNAVLEGPMQIPLKAVGPNLYLSSPLIAVSDSVLRDEQQGAQVVSGLSVRAQSAIPANGTTRGTVQARFILANGTPAVDASIVLSMDGLEGARFFQEGTEGSSTVTLTTGVDGRVEAQVVSSRQGVARLTATASLGGENTAPVGTTVLFISDVLPVPAVAKGFITPNVVWLQPEQVLDPAQVASVEVEVLPDGEGYGTPPPAGLAEATTDAALNEYIRKQDDPLLQGDVPEAERRARFRPLGYAIVKGLRPLVRFKFSHPGLFLESYASPPGPDQIANQLLLEADDGDPAGTLDVGARRFEILGFTGGQEPVVRVRSYPAAPFDVLWQPQEGDLREGPMRFRVWMQGGALQAGSPLGRNVGVVKCLLYTRDNSYVEGRWLNDSLGDFVFPDTPDGLAMTRNALLIGFRQAERDRGMSQALREERLAPCALLRALGMVLGRSPRIQRPTLDSLGLYDRSDTWAAMPDSLVSFDSLFDDDFAREASAEQRRLHEGSRISSEASEYPLTLPSKEIEINWHHYAMDTLAAQALAARAKVKRPEMNTDRVTVSFLDTGFGAGRLAEHAEEFGIALAGAPTSIANRLQFAFSPDRLDDENLPVAESLLLSRERRWRGPLALDNGFWIDEGLGVGWHGTATVFLAMGRFEPANTIGFPGVIGEYSIGTGQHANRWEFTKLAVSARLDKGAIQIPLTPGGDAVPFGVPEGLHPAAGDPRERLRRILRAPLKACLAAMWAQTDNFRVPLGGRLLPGGGTEEQAREQIPVPDVVVVAWDAPAYSDDSLAKIADPDLRGRVKLALQKSHYWFFEAVLDRLSSLGTIVVCAAGNAARGETSLDDKIFPATLAPRRGRRYVELVGGGEYKAWEDHSFWETVRSDPKFRKIHQFLPEVTNIATQFESSSPLVVTVGASAMELVDPRDLSGAVREAFAKFRLNGRSGYAGERVSVAAPGRDITMRLPQGGTERSEGTSDATALVGGVLAEMVYFQQRMGVEDGLTREQRVKARRRLIELLEATADVPDATIPGQGTMREADLPNNEWGFGRVNAWKAMLAVANQGIPEESRYATTTFEGAVVNGETIPKLGLPENLKKDPTIDDPVYRYTSTGAGATIQPATGRHFRDLSPPVDEENTCWYGFQVRAGSAELWPAYYAGAGSYQLERDAPFIVMSGELSLPSNDPAVPVFRGRPVRLAGTETLDGKWPRGFQARHQGWQQFFELPIVAMRAAPLLFDERDFDDLHAGETNGEFLYQWNISRAALVRTGEPNGVLEFRLPYGYMTVPAGSTRFTAEDIELVASLGWPRFRFASNRLGRMRNNTVTTNRPTTNGSFIQFDDFVFDIELPSVRVNHFVKPGTTTKVLEVSIESRHGRSITCDLSDGTTNARFRSLTDRPPAYVIPATAAPTHVTRQGGVTVTIPFEVTPANPIGPTVCAIEIFLDGFPVTVLQPLFVGLQ